MTSATSHSDLAETLRTTAEVLRDLSGRLIARRTVDPRALAMLANGLDAAASTVPRTVYRAYYEAIPLGLYATREAAREHCLADAANHGDSTDGAFWSLDDRGDPAGSEECLVLKGPSCGDLMTDYSVMPLTVQATYDPNAEG